MFAKRIVSQSLQHFEGFFGAFFVNGHCHAAFPKRHKSVKNRTDSEKADMMADFMKIFEEFGTMKDKDPAIVEVQDQVKKLQGFITEHFYTCTNEILSGLGKMYAADSEFRDNINSAGGKGTAEFAAKAIAVYCGK